MRRKYSAFGNVIGLEGFSLRGAKESHRRTKSHLGHHGNNAAKLDFMTVKNGSLAVKVNRIFRTSGRFGKFRTQINNGFELFFLPESL